MALENFKHISLIFGYLLENHVRKSDDFSLNLVEFRLLRISKTSAGSTFGAVDKRMSLVPTVRKTRYAPN